MRVQGNLWRGKAGWVKRATVLVCLIYCFVPSLSAGQAHVQQDCGQLQVGAILPLSGTSASVGQAVRNGIEFAMSELETPLRIHFAFEDDGLEPRRSLQALSKLRMRGVDVVISISSSTSNALAAELGRDETPFIAIASDPNILTPNKNAFLFWNHPADEALMMMQELQSRGITKIIRIISTDAWSLSIQDQLRILEANRSHAMEVEEYELPVDSRDFSTQIARLSKYRNSDDRALQLILVTPQLGPFARQLRAGGFRTPMVGFSSFADRAAQNDAEGALSHSWYVNHVEPPPAFIERFTARYPQGSMYGAAHGYELAMTLSRIASTRCSTRSFQEALNEALRSSGLFGRLSIDASRRVRFPIRVHAVP